MNNPLRVLIAEDSEEDALLLVRELQRGGYAPTFERVETPEAMKASLEKQPWDLVIADYAMPHLSGLAALKLLKENGLDLPLIIVSGTTGEEAAVEAMKAGAHDYIMKNNLARLVPVVERELREAIVRRERKEAEKAFKESERLSWAVLETAPSLIVLTDNAIVHHGVLEKGVNYIQKPFAVESLVRKVREVLDQ